MTAAPAAPERTTLAKATELVDLGIKACEAYKRPDLGARLTSTRKSMADPAVHIVVVGEFKQGKSSLVNALVGANVCPVDDDVATAVPTYVRQGAKPQAEVLYDGDTPRREPIELDQVRGYVVEGAIAVAAGPRVSGVEIQLPRKVLGGGLVMVDTPVVGGLGAAHAAASLAAISLADAVIFVTGAVAGRSSNSRSHCAATLSQAAAAGAAAWLPAFWPQAAVIQSAATPTGCELPITQPKNRVPAMA